MKNKIILLCLIALLLPSCGKSSPWGNNEKYTSLLVSTDSIPTFMNWSRDGQQILLTDIYSMKNNSSLRIYDLQSGMRLLVQTDWGILVGCDWSPDGKKILVSSGDNSTTYRAGIWILSTKTEDQPEFLGEGYTAAWSPDGKTIAIVSVPKVIESSLWEVTLSLYHLDTGSKEVVTSISAPFYQIDKLSWSPTEEKLAYSYQYGDDTGKILHTASIIDLVTKEIVTFTSEATIYYPSWSPEGNMVALVVYRKSPNNALITEPVLAIVNSDGSCLRDIVEGVESASWAPNGQIAVARGSSGIYLLDIRALLGLDTLPQRLSCP
jgi:Tol biopolymer transport system component